jgi:branched-chain amino acid transport system substrate-binding protein
VNHAAFGRRPMHPAAQKFVDLYRAKHGTDRWYGPDAANPLVSLAGTVASGYDCINLLLDAIRRSGGTSAAEMVAALDQTKDFAGATIPAISFTPQNHVALKVDDLGTYEMLKRGDRVVLELRD